MDYCHIENGVIDEGPKPLPRSWRNVSGLDLGTRGELKAKGWLPVTYDNEAYDTGTQIRTGPVGCNVGDTVPSGASAVIGTYTVRAMDADELREVVRRKRRQAYDEAGATIDAMIVALWERDMESRPQAADALEVKRAAVKTRFPAS